MNILQLEDTVKGLPDQALHQEAQSPSGQVPQYLVISEIQRRSDMRKRYEAEAQQPMPTVKDQVLQSGIGAMQPGMQPSMQQGMPGMAGGGITAMKPVRHMFPGGSTGMPGEGALYGLAQQAKALAAITGRNIEDVYNQLVAQANDVVSGLPEGAGGNLGGVNMTGRDSVYGMTDPATDGGNPLSGIGESLGSLAYDVVSGMREGAMGNRGGFNMNNFSATVGPIPEVSDAVDERIAELSYTPTKRPPSIPTPAPDDAGSLPERTPDTATPDTATPDVVTPNIVIPDFQKSSGSKEVQGASKIQMQAKPELSFEDLIGDTKRQMGAQALIGLGAGIAGNDLSGGIAAVGEATRQGTTAMRELAMQERLSKFQAGREDMARASEDEQFERRMAAAESQFKRELDLKREQITSDLDLSRAVSARTALEEATDLATALVESEIGLQGAEKEAAIDRLMRKYFVDYARALGVSNDEIEALREEESSVPILQGMDVSNLSNEELMARLLSQGG